MLPITTFQLSRSETTGISEGGVFTVGKVELEDHTGNGSNIGEAHSLAEVQNSPKLPVLSSDRFIVPLDGVVINGRMINGHSA